MNLLDRETTDRNWLKALHVEYDEDMLKLTRRDQQRHHPATGVTPPAGNFSDFDPDYRWEQERQYRRTMGLANWIGLLIAAVGISIGIANILGE